ncbi:MAG: Crp/Fnr family transcriptional regulator [Pseudomonadota bacterium]
MSNLPEAELQLLTNQMTLVSLRKGETLFHAGEVPRYVYFPVNAIVSMCIDMEDGASIEAYMLGNACKVGMGTVGQPSFYRACVRNSGLAYRMPVQALLHARAHCPTYVQRVFAVTNRMLMQLSQTIVCSKRHTIAQQLMRWMLITLDRTLDTHIEITHQELGEILGFRREAITLALGKMTSQGFIQIQRGEVEVLDRSALEASVCECYWTGQQRQKPTPVACVDCA